MSAPWLTADPPPRPRRIRGGDVATPDPVSWRRQREAARRPALIDQPVAADRDRTGLDLDGLFAIALLLPLLFIVQLTTLGAAMFAGLAPIYLFLRRRGLGRVLVPRAFLFLAPAFALISVLWSEAPGDSLRFAIEYFITIVVGLLLSSAPRQETVIRGLTLAFTFYVAVAVATGGTVGIGVGAGGQAFSGLTSSKNLLADIASTGLIVSLAGVLIAARSRRWLWLVVGVAGICIDLFAVTGARSAGALLGLALGVGSMLTLAPLISASKMLRGWLTGAVALCAVVCAAFYSTVSTALMNLGANLFDKDPTLTGRTYLWYRAADLIREKPLVGRGYYAFWRQGNADAEGLWQYFGITGRGGFTFHNTMVDILVTLGGLGAAIIVLTAVIGAVALIRRFVTRPSLSLVFWMSIFLYQVARTPIETIGLAPFYFSTALAFGALGAAFGRPALRRKPSRAYQPVRPPALQLRAWTTDGPSAPDGGGRLTALRRP